MKKFKMFMLPNTGAHSLGQDPVTNQHILIKGGPEGYEFLHDQDLSKIPGFGDKFKCRGEVEVDEAQQQQAQAVVPETVDGIDTIQELKSSKLKKNKKRGFFDGKRYYITKEDGKTEVAEFKSKKELFNSLKDNK